MYIVERAEIGYPNALGTWDKIGSFETIREIKDYAWACCTKDGKPSVYLCYKRGYIKKALDTVLVLRKENGCLKMKEENVVQTAAIYGPERVLEEILDSEISHRVF